MKNRITLINIITSLVMQVVSIVSGLIIPRIVLLYFGSTVNGLVNSINQYISYVSLIEGGVTGVIAANMYKPLVEKDDKKLSSVLVTASSFYRKISFLLIIYTMFVSIVYPIIVDTGFDNWYVSILTIVLAITTMLQYMFSLTMTTLLQADKKGYVVYLTQTVVVAGNIVLALVSVKIYPDIIFLKIMNAVLFTMQPIIYGIYINNI